MYFLSKKDLKTWAAMAAGVVRLLWTHGIQKAADLKKSAAPFSVISLKAHALFHFYCVLVAAPRVTSTVFA